MNLIRIFVAALALTSAACVSTDVSVLPLGSASYPSYGKDHAVAVYETFNDVDREYVKIGRIQAQQIKNTYGTSIPQQSQIGEVIESMKRKAREVGADALVLREGIEVNTSVETEGGPGSKTVGRTATTGFSPNDIWSHKAIAIRFVKPTHP
jgi:hypothetical protein